MNLATNGKPTTSRPPVLKPPLKPSPAPPSLPKPEPAEPDRILFEKSRTENRPLRFVLTSGAELQGVIQRHGRFSVMDSDGQQSVVVYKHSLERVALLTE